MRRRRAAPWAVLLLVLTALSLVPAPGASASCAAPLVDRPSGPLVPGEPATVTGRYFLDGCDDTGGGSVLGCEERGEVVTPTKGVPLVLTQGRRHWVLATTDADASGRARWSVRIPADVRPGDAVLGPAQGSGTPVVVHR